MQQIKTGSRWTAGSRKFLVTKTNMTGSDSWIFYKNVETGQEYSCLEQAFLNRFTIDLTGN